MLEQGLPNICVEGEISNFARPASGHWYFSLKDSNAQIRCAMFKQRNRLVRPAPREGDKVQLRGKLTLYEARGDYQLVAESMEPAGEGALKRAYEALRQQLEAEGLFAHERKQALPQWPQTIGVITSASGAAVRDIIDVLGRRYAAANVIVYPTSVQGENAPLEIRAALKQAVSRQEAEVLIIGRGGGSLEDLWAFNDEALVRDIAACSIPIVSAVGHETDFSLCDFVADMRAPTPSAAAELVSPVAEDWLAWITTSQQQLKRNMQRRLQQHQQTLDSQHHRLQQQHPLNRLTPYKQRLERLTAQLHHRQQQHMTAISKRLQSSHIRLQAQAPQAMLSTLSNRVAQQHEKLLLAGQNLGRPLRLQLAQLSAKLEVVSPLATLQRGYAIATDSQQRAIVDAGQVQTGDRIDIKLADGELGCIVERSDPSK
jgi:exodeoxyribonuclease VII large subunit